ncbi:MAG: mismatch-specific DNA-glycosylase [Bacillota bacterium]
MHGTRDLLAEQLKVLFIGYNPSLRSAEINHHYAGNANRFWLMLYEAGFTDHKLRPEDDQELLELGLGLTNIVARPTRAASEITKTEYEEGRELLRVKLERYQPRYAAYVGIGVYKVFARNPSAALGLQSVSVVHGVQDFVLPSTSGLNRMLNAEMLNWYRSLKALI